MTDSIRQKLEKLYSEAQAQQTYDTLMNLIGDAAGTPVDLAVSEADVMLIAYGDHVQDGNNPPLQVLHEFLKETIHPLINSVHILPFYPYSSDDGFSVIDYYAVDPNLGDWEHVDTLKADFRLMFDAVFNHISAKSEWFQKYLQDEAPYNEFFIAVPPETDLSAVVRPRALPLLTPVETINGTKHVWTTFSDDQIDLNYGSPELLLEMIRVMLFYVEHGSQFVRLDAIAFLWKVIGTSSIHLEETHIVIQLMREVLNLLAPETVLITETNVPHEENISYFGDGRNEAQLVYQFPLPPLVLHTLTTGDTTALTNWANSLETTGDQTTFFNFTSSHDGIGMRPATGLLTQTEIDALVQLAQDHGGHVSYKTNSDGSQSPYELNITYFDAITHPDITAKVPRGAVQRFMVSQAIALALAGMPGIYLHCLYGSRNYHAGVEETGRYRSINREKLNATQLRESLADKTSIQHQVFAAYRHLIDARRQEPAFHPLAAQKVLSLSPAIFAIERTAADGSTVLALHNVTDQAVMLDDDMLLGTWRDLLSETTIDIEKSLTLQGYQIVWMKRI